MTKATLTFLLPPNLYTLFPISKLPQCLYNHLVTQIQLAQASFFFFFFFWIPL
jgi:hypothetical protein